MAKGSHSNITVRVETNLLLPPPCRTGNPEQDIDTLYKWCSGLYDVLIRSDNQIGVIRALIRQVQIQAGKDTNVAEQFARLLSDVATLRTDVDSLLP